MILRVLPRAKLMVVMLDLPCHDMHYCVVLWCEVYYVIVYGLGIITVVFLVKYLDNSYSRYDSLVTDQCD